MVILVKGIDIKNTICAKHVCNHEIGCYPYDYECGLGYCVTQMCGNGKAMPSGNIPQSK